ncbi:D-glycero-alpha-D-manno-heptose-1,7-bisphosphate 7-phosphatase [Streptomyces sp. NPDC003483]
MRPEQIDAVLLDRDGVLNRNRPAHVRRPDEWQWLPQARQACRSLTEAELALAVVTNQAAVGRGLLSVPTLGAIHARMIDDLAVDGVAISAVLYCPHAPADSCHCRKPKPGMLLAALHRLGADPSHAVMVGDHLTDLLAAEAAGCWSIHVRSGRGSPPTHPIKRYLGSVADLQAAARLLLG